MIDLAAQFRRLGYRPLLAIGLAIFAWCRMPFPPGARGGDA